MITVMKVTEDNFIPLLCQKHEKALEYCMLHYGGLVKAVIHRYLGNLPEYEEGGVGRHRLAILLW